MTADKGKWTIHGKCYDLSKFKCQHPGGKEFLEMAQGSDCTATFESYHKNSDFLAATKLPEYESADKANVDDAILWKWHKNNFYHVLKERVYAAVTKTHSLAYDGILLFVILCYYLSMLLVFFSPFKITAAVVHGLCRTIIGGGGHNYLHGKTKRGIFLEFGLFSSFAWKIRHIFSHHAYTNTDKDIDYTDFLFIKKLPLWLRPLTLLIAPIISYVESYYFLLKNKASLFYYIGRIYLLLELILWVHFSSLSYYGLQYLVSTLYFLLLVTSNHMFEDTTQIATRDEDWGIHQIQTSRDFKITGWFKLDCILGISINCQIAHHLFPAFKSPFAYQAVNKILEQTCKDFNVPLPATEYIWKTIPKAFKYIMSRK
jgi:fatty acid desaturase